MNATYAAPDLAVQCQRCQKSDTVMSFAVPGRGGVVALCADCLIGASAQDPALAQLLGRLLSSLMRKGRYKEYFPLWQNLGVHVTPVHFYQPVPDTRTLSDELWKKSSPMTGVAMQDEVQLDLLRNVFPRFRQEYEALPLEPTDSPADFFLNNNRFSGTDALALFCMVRHFQPRTVLEIGSGMSSRLSALAARRNGRTELKCIEPYPDEVLQAGFPGLTELICRPVQEVPLDLFRQLQKNDILFIDSSHVVTCGSDVNYLLLEVLPVLQPGVVVHVHDIFLPNEYPRDWIKEEYRFWNEQYLLHAFLLFNSEFEVLLANSYLGTRYRAEMQACFPKSPWLGGGSFWFRRRV